jgi:serine/threonine protein kinase
MTASRYSKLKLEIEAYGFKVRDMAEFGNVPLQTKKLKIQVKRNRYGKSFVLKEVKGFEKLREILHLHQTFNDPARIIPIEFVILNARKTYICMKYCKAGNLEEWLALKGDDLSVKKISSIARKLIEDLKYLHDNGISHGNLKPSNILMFNNQPYLADLEPFTVQNKRQQKSAFLSDLKSLSEIFSELICSSSLTTIYQIQSRANLLNKSELDFLLIAHENSDPSYIISKMLSSEFMQGRLYCIVCLDYQSEERMMGSCSDDNLSHSICLKCFRHMLKLYCVKDYYNWTITKGEIPCPYSAPLPSWPPRPHQRCQNRYSAEAIISSLNLPKYLLDKYKTVQDIREAEHAECLKIQEEKQNLSSTFEGIVELFVHEIEEILNLACPRCGQAFIDYSGCSHLTCSRCSCPFCSMCLVEFDGSSSHTSCASSSKSNAYLLEHKSRALARIQDMLGSCDPAVKHASRDQVHKLLGLHGLTINS